MDRKGCIETITSFIPDPEVRRFIFCGDYDDLDSFLTDRDRILVYYSPLINLAFAYFYGRYRKWKDSGENVDLNGANTNFNRTMKTLDLLYGTYDLSFELMENILLDYQLDCSMGEKIKGTLKIEGMDLDNNFSKYAYKARKYRRTSRLFEDLSITEQRDELMKFLTCFPFLRDLKIRTEIVPDVTKADREFEEPKPYNKIKHVYLCYLNGMAKTGKAELDTFGQIEEIEKEFYYLERIEVHTDASNRSNTRSMMLIYTLIGDYDHSKTVIIENEDDGFDNEIPTIRGEGVAEQYYMTLIPGIFTLEQGSSILKDLHAINYRYVKNLALALSDVMTEDSKKAFANKYRVSYPALFDNGNDGGYDWDKILSIIIIKENVNNVLKTIFESDIQCLTKLVKNLETRFGANRINSGGLLATIKARCEKVEKNSSINTPLFSTSRTKSNQAEVAANTIIDSLARAVNNNEYQGVDNLSFPLDMKGRRDYINGLTVIGVSVEERARVLRHVVMQTFRGIVAFYEGLFALAEEKRIFEDESYYKILSAEEVAAYQDSMESKFRERVKSVIEELGDEKYSDIPGILERVNELCHKCISDSGEQTHYGKILKDLIGRSSVMEFNKVRDLHQYLSHIQTEDEFVNAVRKVDDVFNYIAHGSTSKQHIASVYPYVATYEYANYGKDGFKVERFSMVIDNLPVNVEILTELSYKIGNRFFILPNLSRSSETIWIDPVIISISDFDMNSVSGER